jgi:uncharacterized iron-regulated membrane protein
MAQMRKIIFKLHLIVAIGFGVFIVLLGVTGSIMAFEQELERAFHPELSYVTPQGEAKSLAEIGTAAEKAYPNEKIRAYGLSTARDISYQVLFDDAAVYVNQYTGAVLGIRTEDPVLLQTVHSLHLRLAMMNKGRQFGETTIKWSGVAALFLVITGAYLWWPVKRVSIHRDAESRRFWFDVHNAFGIFSLLFVLTLVITGIIIGFEDQTTALFYKITSSLPPPRLRLEAMPVPGATPITPDQARAIARVAAPGAAPSFINVAEGKNVYRINARYPEDRTPGGRTRVAIDPYSGKVLLLVDSRGGPGGYKLVNLNRAIHTGDIFGMASKTVMSLASLIMALQFVSGVVMWLKRRTAEEKARPAAV